MPKMFSASLLLFFGTFCSMVMAGEMGPVPDDVNLKKSPKAQVPFDLASLKQNWRSRIEAIRASGKLPIIDIESSYNPGKFDTRDVAKMMDSAGIALIAFSPQSNRKHYFKKGKVWTDNARRLVEADPWRYIPVTDSGNYPAWSEGPGRFLDKTIEKAAEDGYPLMGEFEFRHYLSPRQHKRGATHRDVTIPIDGELGQQLFGFAERSGIPFQIHYEIEDVLLPVLEVMLKKYPKVKVIWCHFAQIRYQDRSTVYSPAYVRKLIETHPNLYFDLAFGGPDSVYPGSDEYHSRIWDQENGGFKAGWKKLIVDHPWRFLAALDLGGDRLYKLPEYAQKQRRVLAEVPPEVRDIVAYRAAWKLLFNEEI